jgi:hypothetical protein
MNGFSAFNSAIIASKRAIHVSISWLSTPFGSAAMFRFRTRSDDTYRLAATSPSANRFPKSRSASDHQRSHRSCLSAAFTPARQDTSCPLTYVSLSIVRSTP